MSKNNFKSVNPDRAKELLIYDTDTGNLIWRPRDYPLNFNKRFSGKIAGHTHTCTVGKKYIQVRVDNVLHYAHRIIWVMLHGPIGRSEEIDHINGDGTDNRIENLRLVTSSQNKRNQRKLCTNTSGYTGVYYDKRRGDYYARVWHGATYSDLGRAATAEACYLIRQAYDRENGFHANHGSDRPL